MPLALCVNNGYQLKLTHEACDVHRSDVEGGAEGSAVQRPGAGKSTWHAANSV